LKRSETERSAQSGRRGKGGGAPAATPVMEQYARIKSSYPGCMLLFRMGDFYEMFFEDAVRASEVLGIALTSRSKSEKGKVPMAGIPWHSAESYIAKLIKAGIKVAVCEQLSDPKNSRGLVDRGVVEVITPGTVMSDGMLEERDNNYVGAVFSTGGRCGVALADVSTGQFVAGEIEPGALVANLGAYNLSELVVPESGLAPEGVLAELEASKEGLTLTRREDWLFDYAGCRRLLTDHFDVSSLSPFGCEDLHEGVCAAGALLSYLKEVRMGAVPQIRKLARLRPGDHMHLDEATRRNLELVWSPSGRQATLLGLLDRTVTPMGARLLKAWILAPLVDPSAVNERLDAVEEFVSSQSLREEAWQAMREMRDIERLAAKVACAKANPRDLLSLAASLKAVPRLAEALGEARSSLLEELARGLDAVEEASSLIDGAISEDAPVQATEGNVIKRGYSGELDELEREAREGKEWIAGLQEMERSTTGIPSLKVGFNKVFGYYIEVTRPHLKSVPDHYIRKQTLVNAERFVTPELKRKEEIVLGAEERRRALEYEIFCKTRDAVAALTPRIQATAEAIAAIDSLLSLASVAVEGGYCRPEIHAGDALEIIEGRHPVLERIMGRSAFVANDARLDTSERQIAIITGPNMAGKSTYLRQVGLIVLMGQIGSFVPAKSASYGVVDRIFTRVGASDNLFRGESTFLVEMNETSNILHNATPRSLILLDEVGRGTSTYDGISIAWAVTEYLHGEPSVRAKTLFATHYHELTNLASRLERVVNVNVQVKEWNDRVIFLRKVVDGAADKSYGVQVARLAGLPERVVERAKEVLARFEGERTPLLSGRAGGAGAVAEGGLQYDLFAPRSAADGAEDKAAREVLEELRSLDPENMTPMEALSALAKLKGRAGGGEEGVGGKW